MTSTSIEAAANVLLRERAVRQALVDRLQGNSLWATFAGRMVLPVGIAALVVGVSASWSSGPAVSTLVAVVVASVFWLSLDLAHVSRRLRALTVVLEATGALAAFVDGAASGGQARVE